MLIYDASVTTDPEKAAEDSDQKSDNHQIDRTDVRVGNRKEHVDFIPSARG